MVSLFCTKEQRKDSNQFTDQACFEHFPKHSPNQSRNLGINFASLKKRRINNNLCVKKKFCDRNFEVNINANYSSLDWCLISFPCPNPLNSKSIFQNEIPNRQSNKGKRNPNTNHKV